MRRARPPGGRRSAPARAVGVDNPRHPCSVALVRVPPAIPVLILAALLAGCETTSHQVRIESAANPLPAEAPKPQSFWIRSRQADPTVESLRYHEALGHIKTALSGKGLYEAPSEGAADMIIEVDYGVEPLRRRVEIEETRGSRRRSAAKGKPPEENPVAAADGPAIARQPAEPIAVNEARGEVLINVGFYKKRLSLEARQNRAKAEPAPGTPEFLWRVEVENESESKDLRKFVPLLASATIDFIESNTHGRREILVDEDGKDVVFVKKGL